MLYVLCGEEIVLLGQRTEGDEQVVDNGCVKQDIESLYVMVARLNRILLWSMAGENARSGLGFSTGEQ